MQPIISVCIANYNGEHLLDPCLASIRSQSFTHKVELLVHDDASTDDSVRILKQRHPDVVLIESRTNVGYCQSNNRLAQKAKGKYLLFLNNDATLRADALATLYRAAEQEIRPAALSLPQYDMATGNLVDRGVRMDLLHTPFANQREHCNKLSYVQAACMLVSHDTWNDLGGFPEWMVSNAEDVYFCTLVRLVGGRVAVIEGSGYDHWQGHSFGGNRISGDRLVTTYHRRYLSERNRAGMILVCTPTLLAWPLYAAHLAILLLEGIVISFLSANPKAWTRIYWPACRDSTRMLHRLSKARKAVQAIRRATLRDYLRVLSLMPHKLATFVNHGLPSLS